MPRVADWSIRFFQASKTMLFLERGILVANTKHTKVAAISCGILLSSVDVRG